MRQNDATARSMTRGSQANASVAPGLPGCPSLDACRELQKAIRTALNSIADDDPDAKLKTEKLAQSAVAHCQFRPRRYGRLVLEEDVVVMPSDIPACAWLAVLHLLISTTRIGDRLGRCGAPGCGRYNVSFRGRPRRHCSAGHRRLFDRSRGKERMRAGRDKHAEKAGAPVVSPRRRGRPKLRAIRQVRRKRR